MTSEKPPADKRRRPVLQALALAVGIALGGAALVSCGEKERGLDWARRAAELDPALKIMFITGFAAVALHPDSEAPRDAKILSKPFHLRDLVSEVDRMIAA